MIFCILLSGTSGGLGNYNKTTASSNERYTMSHVCTVKCLPFTACSWHHIHNIQLPLDGKVNLQWQNYFTLLQFYCIFHVIFLFFNSFSWLHIYFLNQFWWDFPCYKALVYCNHTYIMFCFLLLKCHLFYLVKHFLEFIFMLFPPLSLLYRASDIN